jgi:hypothetical protein
MSFKIVFYFLFSPFAFAFKYNDFCRYMFISGVLEIPSYFMVPPLIGFFGRRMIFSSFLLLCGICLMTSLLFPQGTATLS